MLDKIMQNILFTNNSNVPKNPPPPQKPQKGEIFSFNNLLKRNK